MLTQQENEMLTRVGPGTPMGELLRRYWQPICVAGELTAEQPRRRVRVLGEDLVAFRDASGGYGLLGEHCSHRGTSLYYGFLEDGGLRCPYHGFVYLRRAFPSVSARPLEKLNIPGIELIPSSRRIYPQKFLASQLLGFVMRERRVSKPIQSVTAQLEGGVFDDLGRPFHLVAGVQQEPANAELAHRR